MTGSVIIRDWEVAATYDGRKTQHRTPVAWPPWVGSEDPGDDWELAPDGTLVRLSDQRPVGMVNPPHRVGSRLRARESWRTGVSLDGMAPAQVLEAVLDAGYSGPWAPVLYPATGASVHADTLGSFGGEWGRLRSACSMPAWASRLALEVVAVRVCRLQDLTEADAAAEGVELDIWDQTLVARQYDDEDRWFQTWDEDLPDYVPIERVCRESFRTAWDSRYQRRAPWAANPWVWVTTFRVCPT